jgi:hypothetical protein
MRIFSCPRRALQILNALCPENMALRQRAIKLAKCGLQPWPPAKIRPLPDHCSATFSPLSKSAALLNDPPPYMIAQSLAP